MRTRSSSTGNSTSGGGTGGDGKGGTGGTTGTGGTGGTARQHAQRIYTAVAGNWVSRAYLALCLGLLVWVWVDSALVEHQDASLAGVVPVLVTAPTSILIVLVPEGSALGYYLVVAAAALVNAALIGLCLRLVRGGRSGSPALRGG